MVRITLEQYKRLVAIENPSSPLVPALLRPEPPPSLPSPQIRRASSSDHPVVPPNTAGAAAHPWPPRAGTRT